ncbi:hypothetical protein H0H93_014900 [Arthromyces matolae]|nr:hypothetical protein H0H93_014900 [Arthromyces matolae]
MSIASTSTRTRPLPHRLLFPSITNDAPLPDLVGITDLDAELYDVLALALRAFVLPWWSRISRYDKQFLPIISNVLTVVIRSLDARIRTINLPPLLLIHAPAIVTQHYRDYRNAHSKLTTSYAAGGAASLPQLFHQLQPHIAVSPDGNLDKEYFRQLVDHILHVCLPEENYKPDAERFIVREIILKVLLNDVIPKITQPWFIHRSILDLLQLQARLSQPRPPSPPSTSSFSFHTIIVLVLSAIQTISGVCLALIQAYKSTVNTIKRVNERHSPQSANSLSSSQTYAEPLLTMFSELFTLQDRTASTFLLTTVRVMADFSSSFLDRLLSHLLETKLSLPFILTITRLSKRTLFPNGYPGPPPIEPTLEEQAEFRALLVGWRPQGALASRLLPLLLGPDPSKTLEAALDPLSSAPCNVHLVLFLLDLVVLELFPELALPTDTDGVSRRGISDSDSKDNASLTTSEASLRHL